MSIDDELPVRPRRRSGEPRVPAVVDVAPIQAALTQESVPTARDKMRRRTTRVPWMEEVRDYDQNGPGVAGYYLDTVALMASMCPMYVSIRNNAGEYERSDDPVLQVALDGWRGALMSQTDLTFAAVRGREAVGRVWNIKDPETGYNVTLSIREVDENRVGWTDLYGRERVVFRSAVWKSWYPDPYQPHEPTSPMRRACADLKRLRSFIRNQNSAADSKLLTNGIVSFGHDPDAGSRPYQGLPNTGQGESTREGVPSIIDDYLELSKLAHRDGESPAAMVPFPIEGPPAVYTELGRLIDPVALEAERMAIEAFARDVNFPQQLLTMGPGAANHWNEFLVQETAVKVSLAPKLQPVCNDVAEFHVKPMVERLRQQLATWKSVDPRRIRVEFDLSFLLRRPSKFQEVLEAYRLGILTRQQVADELGISGELLAIPVGMSEYEHWELSTMGKGAPYAETDLDNNLIVPDPMGGDPNAAPPAAGPAGGQDVGGMVADALGTSGGAPGGGDLGAVTEPPTPAAIAAALTPGQWTPQKAAMIRSMQPVTAALTPNPDEVTQALYEDAAQHDLSVNAELTGLIAVVAATIQAEVARRIITAHPSRSDARRRLTELPVDQVWEQADPQVKASFPLDDVIAETIDRYRPQIQAVYDQAAESFLHKWGPVIGAVVVTGAVGSAVDNLVGGLAGWAKWRYTGAVKSATGFVVGTPGDTHTPTGVGMVTKHVGPDGQRDVATVPSSLVRESMTVAGGAQTDREGRLLLDGGNNPQPVTGGAWTGNAGWFTGHNIVAAAPRPPLRWKWYHGWIRTPAVPFEPHRLLDGETFDKPSDVPGGMYPGDHKLCSCGLLPHV